MVTRVFENHEATDALAHFAKERAESELIQAKKMLAQRKRDMKHFSDDIAEIDARLQDRLQEIMKQQDFKPRFRSEERAMRRQERFEARMREIYGKNWKVHNEPRDQFKGIHMRAQANRLPHKETFKSQFKRT